MLRGRVGIRREFCCCYARVPGKCVGGGAEVGKWAVGSREVALPNDVRPSPEPSAAAVRLMP